MGDIINSLALALLGLIALATQIFRWASEKKREESIPEPIRRAETKDVTAYFQSPKSSETIRRMAKKIDDLWDWHSPSKDPATGQPRFNWYTAPIDDTRYKQMEEMLGSISRLLKESREGKRQP